MKQSSTETIIGALRILARDIHTDDGVANAALYEAAERLEQYHAAITKTLAENGHLADGDVCTLIDIKRAVGGEFSPWVKIDYGDPSTWPVASKPCLVAWDAETCAQWRGTEPQTWERLAMRVADGDAWQWAECFSGEFEDFDPPPTHWCYATQFGG